MSRLSEMIEYLGIALGVIAFAALVLIVGAIIFWLVITANGRNPFQ